MRDKLLKTNRPLGNASPKNDMLYMLGAYDRRTWKVIDAIISIRNFFAHHLDASFDSTTTEFTKAINTLNLHEGLKYYPLAKARTGEEKYSKNLVESPINNRVKFIVNLKLSLIVLMRDRLSHEEWSNRPRADKADDEEPKRP